MRRASRQCRRRHRARGLSPVRPLSTAPLWTASSRVARSCGPNQSVDGRAWRSGCARADIHEQRQSGPLDLPRFLRQERPRGGAVLAAGAAQRPDLDVHAAPAWCSSRTSSPARRRAPTRAPPRRRSACAPAASTTTSTTSATPTGITPSSRCSAISRSATTSRSRRSRWRGSWSRRTSALDRQAPARHHLPRRRGRLPHLEEGGGLLRRQDHPHRHLRQLLVGGRHGAVRAVLGDLPRPGRQGRGRPAGQRRPGRRPLPRDSGTSSSCSTSSAAPATASTCPSPRSTPAWASSA